ncbi:hypothetical protein BDR04DRAFT_1122715 [Suillus decipiens]|nr:hypothetical protein BDR04DRAFT_1122715 [Suillus decipiens]
MSENIHEAKLQTNWCSGGWSSPVQSGARCQEYGFNSSRMAIEVQFVLGNLLPHLFDTSPWQAQTMRWRRSILSQSQAHFAVVAEAEKLKQAAGKSEKSLIRASSLALHQAMSQEGSGSSSEVDNDDNDNDNSQAGQGLKNAMMPAAGLKRNFSVFDEFLTPTICCNFCAIEFEKS